MRYFTFLLLFSLCLSVLAQKKMTIRNSETGEEMTITVPDGLVITSGIEGEDGDFVVTDTLYADNGESCIVDTVACDTVKRDLLVSADGLYNLALQYQSEGKFIEMGIALYQSWLMGSMDEVDAFISQHEDVKKALAFMIFPSDNPRYTICVSMDKTGMPIAGKLISNTVNKLAEYLNKH